MKILLTAALAVATLAQAQTSTLPKDHEQLRFALVLSRHGIRPPLHPNSELNLRSSDPWPDWEVPLGHLTPHGALALQAMGAYMRHDYARAGLIAGNGCPPSNEIYTYADIDERNISSTRATFKGFAPDCPAPPVNIVNGQPDAMLSDKFYGAPPAEKTAASQPSDHAIIDAELKEFADILAPDPKHPAAKPILNEPNPLGASSSLIEDILLEYYDGKPLSEVGWGRVDPTTIHRLIILHAPAFGATDTALHTDFSARYKASNVILHILDTLQQAAAGKPVTGAIGPVGTKLVYISGHDTNLYTVATALGLKWNFNGAINDTAPDSQIVFELWQRPGVGTYDVRIRAVQQTTDQLRSAAQLIGTHPPDVEYITPTGCGTTDHCSLATFTAAVKPILNAPTTRPDLQPTKVAP